MQAGSRATALARTSRSCAHHLPRAIVSGTNPDLQNVPIVGAERRAALARRAAAVELPPSRTCSSSTSRRTTSTSSRSPRSGRRRSGRACASSTLGARSMTRGLRPSPRSAKNTVCSEHANGPEDRRWRPVARRPRSSSRAARIPRPRARRDAASPPVVARAGELHDATVPQKIAPAPSRAAGASTRRDRRSRRRASSRGIAPKLPSRLRPPPASTRLVVATSYGAQRARAPRANEQRRREARATASLPPAVARHANSRCAPRRPRVLAAARARAAALGGRERRRARLEREEHDAPEQRELLRDRGVRGREHAARASACAARVALANAPLSASVRTCITAPPLSSGTSVASAGGRRSARRAQQPAAHEQRDDLHGAADGLGERGRERGARDAEPAAEDEERVEQRVERVVREAHARRGEERGPRLHPRPRPPCEARGTTACACRASRGTRRSRPT